MSIPTPAESRSTASEFCESQRGIRLNTSDRAIFLVLRLLPTFAMADFILFEGPMGFSLFKVAHKGDSVGHNLKEVQEGVDDLAKFGKMVQLSSFLPFEYAL